MPALLIFSNLFLLLTILWLDRLILVNNWAFIFLWLSICFSKSLSSYLDDLFVYLRFFLIWGISLSLCSNYLHSYLLLFFMIWHYSS